MDRKELEKLTKASLLELAKEQDLSGLARLKKDELIDMLADNGPNSRSASNSNQPITGAASTSSIKSPASKTAKGFSLGDFDALTAWQEKVISSKYVTGLALKRKQAAYAGFCGSEEPDQAVLMVRDPYNLYLYWNLSASQYYQFPNIWVRVYDITGIDFNGVNAHSYFDLEIKGHQSSCYIQIPKADTDYCVEIGVKNKEGKFIPLIRSNQVKTPPAKMRAGSAIEGIDFSQKPLGISSLEKGKIGRFESEWASRALGSLPLHQLVSSYWEEKPGPQRKFRFILNTELIVYGATEPDAEVTIWGKPIKLREDGTFSLRLALPDGVQVIPASATSADRVEKRTITPVVSRKTE